MKPLDDLRRGPWIATSLGAILSQRSATRSEMASKERSGDEMDMMRLAEDLGPFCWKTPLLGTDQSARSGSGTGPTLAVFLQWGCEATFT
jgi:hypothetical protein